MRLISIELIIPHFTQCTHKKTTRSSVWPEVGLGHSFPDTGHTKSPISCRNPCSYSFMPKNNLSTSGQKLYGLTPGCSMIKGVEFVSERSWGKLKADVVTAGDKGLALQRKSFCVHSPKTKRLSPSIRMDSHSLWLLVQPNPFAVHSNRINDTACDWVWIPNDAFLYTILYSPTSHQNTKTKM